MDIRQELADWLEFYRELGIEEFYRRAPGCVAPLPARRRMMAHSAPVVKPRTWPCAATPKPR